MRSVPDPKRRQGMGTSVRRGTRLLALALSTGTLTAAVGGIAGASTSSTVSTRTVRSVVANANGSALEIVVNLPKGVTLPDGSTSIKQAISLTDGKVSTVGAVSALANALLGAGNIPAVSNLLAKSVHTSLAGKTKGEDAVLAQKLGPIDIGLGTLSGHVTSPTSTVTGTLATGESKLAHLTVAAGLPNANLAAPVSTITKTLNNQLQSG